MNLIYQQITPYTAIVSESKTSSSLDQVFQMKIRDLPIFESCIDYSLSVRDVAILFDQHPDWPGVILTNQNHYLGTLSRQSCFEVLGRPFGIEIFSKKPILELFNTSRSSNLLLDWNTTIKEAVKSALKRDQSMIYEPIAVQMEECNYGLLNMHVLLLAQCDLLENLYIEVQQLSVKDPLTNLNNRRGFFEAAQPEIEISKVNHTDLSALMIDIDNFKITNDVYGHFVGDRVICVVAEECQKALRLTDLLGRFGGEEFIALLPNTSVETAYKIAERLRIKVENKKIFVNGYQVSVSISIGVCHIKDARGSLDTLLTQADQAMYCAKTAGRNQVMVWDYQLAYCKRQDWVGRDVQESRLNRWPSSIHSATAQVYDETIEGWAKALEMRDKETENHSKRVVNMTLALARKSGINEKDLVDIRRGALLHDIGKIAIPDPILFKPGPLTDEEWEVMRKHPIYAFELLSPMTFLQKSIDIPYCHHEHWDGSGYPRGLKGEEIPLAARIFSIIDVWDALSTDRCYRLAWQPVEVQKYILDQSGRLLDPTLTPIFLKLLEEQSIQAETSDYKLFFNEYIPNQ